MATNSQVINNSNIDPLEQQLRECFGRVVYTHKTHEKCADIILTLHKRLKFLLIVLSALVTTSLLTKIFGNQDWAVIVATILSSLLFGLNSYLKDYDLGEIAQKHSFAATELWNIRESYLSLLVEYRLGIMNINSIKDLRDELQKRLYSIYSGSPRTNYKAYKEASKSLKEYEEYTFSNEEIDKFLPESLRYNK